MRCLFGLLLALAALPLGADERVLVRRPIVTLVHAPLIPETCHTTEHITACMYFAGQRLVCECRESSDGWRIDARAQFVPVINVSPRHIGALTHENAHIRDVERSAIAYVAELSSRLFDSQIACEREAAAESARFVEMMNSFKEESNRLRHPWSLNRGSTPER